LSEYVEFSVHDKDRFASLCKVFDALKSDKESGSFRNDDEWRALFDSESLSHFWWPTNEELDAFTKKWEAMPWQERATSPELQTSWDFDSMIDAFKDGEYELQSCRMVAPDKARFEFFALAWPYGGTACMKALLEAFGFKVTAEDDGRLAEG
jgi:hypothetical protein